MRTPLKLLAAALIATMIVGCSAEGDVSTDDVTAAEWTSSADDSAPDAASPEPSATGEVDADAETDTETADEAQTRTFASGQQTGRRVIRTAELVLESSDTAELLGRIRAVTERAGGYTATSDLQRDDDGVVRGTVTLRVPTETLSEVVEDLEELGDSVPVNRIDERDVTGEYADMQARIDNLTSYESELRTLLADVRETTTDPEDLLRVFERIRTVREEIDLIEGRLAALGDQVSLATVTVTLRPVDEDNGTGIEEGSWAPGETFREALAATRRLLTALADGLIWFVVTGVPVLVAFLGLPALGIYLLIRWLRRNRPARPTDEAGTPPHQNHPQPTSPGEAPSTPTG